MPPVKTPKIIDQFKEEDPTGQALAQPAPTVDEPADEVTNPSASSQQEWDTFVNDFDEDDSPGSVSGVAGDLDPTTLTEEHQPAEKPDTTSDDDGNAQPEEEVVSESPTTPEQPQEPAQVSTPQEPQAPVQSAPSAAPEQLAEFRRQALESLTHGYKLSEEDAQSFIDNPAEALPKFAAELHLRVYDQVVKSVAGQLPQLVKTLSTQQAVEVQKRNEFFSKYSDLEPFEAEVTNLAAFWAQQNPGKPVDQDKLARIARAALNLPAPSGEQPRAQNQVVRTPAAAPVVPSNQAPPQNIWQQMAEDILNDEDDF